MYNPHKENCWFNMSIKRGITPEIYRLSAIFTDYVNLLNYFPLTEASKLRSIVWLGRDHFGFSPRLVYCESTASTV